MKIKNKLRYLLNYRIIAKSKYFNKRWYLNQYPDVKKAGIDPVTHYLELGWKEGRNPSKKFNNNKYLKINPDVKCANMNPLLHYEKYGKKEKRENFSKDILFLNEKAQVTFLLGNKKNVTKKIISKINSFKNIQIWFDHAWKGGTELYTLNKIAESAKNTCNIRIQNKSTDLYYITIYTLDSNIKIVASGIKSLQIFLESIKFNLLIVNNLAGYLNINEVFTLISYLKKIKNIKVSYRAHDFQSICPNITMVNNKNNYCDCKNLNSCISCFKTVSNRLKITSITNWHNNWAVFFNTICDEVIAFSESTKYILIRLYPVIKSKITVVQHISTPLRKVFIPEHKEINIGIPGEIDINKGALIVKEMSKILSLYPNVKITVIGKLIISEELKNVSVLGPYQREKLPEILEQNKIDILFISSICPETYSYTTDEAMMMGIPVAIFNIGAPPERIKNYDKGLIISKIEAKTAIEEIIAFVQKLKSNKDLKTKKLLVHLHLYYQNQIGYFFTKLKNITRDFDLFVTIVKDSKKLKKRIYKKYPSAKITVVPNVGYDISSFVNIINSVNLNNYEYLIKLHSKNYRKKLYTLHGTISKGFAWRDALVDALIGSKKIFNSNYKLFSNNTTLGMIGNEKLLGNSTAPLNKEAREQLCKKLNIENKSCVYVKGTMFMCKANLLEPIKKLNLQFNDFPASTRTGDSGTIAHALEDLFAQVIWEAGHQVKGININDKIIKVETASVITKNKFISIFGKKEIAFIDDKPANNYLHTKGLFIFFFFIPIGVIIKNKKLPPYETIKHSKYFKEKEYVSMYPDIKESNLDPINHYLQIGWKLGYNPSYKFNQTIYLENNKDVFLAKINPLLHFENYGKNEGRVFKRITAGINKENLKIIKNSKLFNKKWYLKNYPEIKKTNYTPEEHFLLQGWKENKNPCKKFITEKYLKFNIDVKDAEINPLIHFEKHGKKEGRYLEAGTFCQRLLNFLLNKTTQFKLFKRNYVIAYDLVIDKKIAPIDNFAFFQYASNLKDKNLTVYYVLNKDYPFFKEIKKQYGNKIIGFKKNSIAFYSRILLLNLKTRFILDSYDVVFNIFKDLYYKSKNIDVIFTQHGITFFKDTYINRNVYGADNLNKITISNEYEYSTFTKRGGFKNEDIIKLGLFRWDLLKNTPPENEKYIFVFLTYRRYLRDSKISETNYYKNYISLLSNNKLLSYLTKHNIKIKVALHHGMLDCKEIHNLKNVDIIPEEKISEMKNKASMLITDLSSMCFEFMVQEKPVIFYRLDENDFWSSKKDSEFSQNLNELTPLVFNVFYNETDVINKTINYIDNKFRLSKEDLKKCKKFFYHSKNIREQFYNYLFKNKDKK